MALNGKGVAHAASVGAGQSNRQDPTQPHRLEAHLTGINITARLDGYLVFKTSAASDFPTATRHDVLWDLTRVQLDDVRQWVSSIQVGSIMSLVYGYDQVGNVRTITEPIVRRRT